MDVSVCNAAREGRVAKPRRLECQDRIESANLSEKSDENRRLYEESQRRREVAGVPLARPGRVAELPPAEDTAGAAKNRESDG